MKLRNILLAATIIAAPLALSNVAKAQPVNGMYVAGGVGYNINEGFKGSGSAFGVNQSGTLSLHNGFTGDASVGYGFGNGIRVELEGDYFENSFDKVKSGGVSHGVTGHDQTYGFFANALYDLDVGSPYVYPYLGGGVGYQEVNFKDLASQGAVINQSKGAFAVQGIAGLAFPIAPIPGLSATLEYRFVDILDGAKYNGTLTQCIDGCRVSPVSAKVGDNINNSFLVGLRYAFGVAAPVAPPTPAPMAAPAPAPAKTYLVFFDWDKYSLTPRATQIIAEAAADSQTAKVTTINVSGYTDTSGTPTYNQGLSIRRAKAVAMKLMADGVPASEISIHGYGETHLLVPTGPGVREPQNRRVEIVLN
ncbi:MAG: OmpA family protein [Acidocella sp.]|nr:OmpA family protein [Acidocella sp.]